MYLIDTPIWLDFLHGKTTPHVRLLEALLEDGDAFLCEVTSLEISRAARDPRRFRKMARTLSSLPFFSLPLSWHERGSLVAHRLGRAGFKPGLRELLLLVTASSHGATLVTRDGRLHRMGQLERLSLL